MPNWYHLPRSILQCESERREMEMLRHIVDQLIDTEHFLERDSPPPGRRAPLVWPSSTFQKYYSTSESSELLAVQQKPKKGIG